MKSINSKFGIIIITIDFRSRIYSTTGKENFNVLKQLAFYPKQKNFFFIKSTKAENITKFSFLFIRKIVPPNKGIFPIFSLFFLIYNKR